MSGLRRRLDDAALAAVAIGLSIHAALFSVTVLGDYPVDGGPALSALLHGNMRAFAQAHPAMGDLSLLVRAPFAGLAYLGHPTTANIYRWGVLPCVLAVAVLGLWLARIARSRGVGLLGQLLIVVLAVQNPLTSSAISLGHPEELLTAALCVGALVAALDQRLLLTAALLGLALSCKQWSIVTVLPILFALQRDRIRALMGAVILAALVTIPQVAGSPAAYLNNQLFLTRQRGSGSSQLSWWYPFTSSSTRYVLVEGVKTRVTLAGLPAGLVHSLRALIIGVDALLAILVARVRGLPLRPATAFALMAAVLLLRSTLDTETVPYYHAALFLDLLAWDAFTGEGLPLRALSGAAVSWALFDRFEPNAVGVLPSGIIYGATMAVVLLLLTRTMFKAHPTSQIHRDVPSATRAVRHVSTA